MEFIIALGIMVVVMIGATYLAVKNSARSREAQIDLIRKDWD